MTPAPIKSLLDRTLATAALTGSTLFFFFVIGLGFWQSLRGTAW